MTGASSDPFIAAEEIIRQIPDVLVTDLFLPQKDPISFLRRLSEAVGVRMPAVLVCSGCLNLATLEMVRNFGIYRCFVKPMCCETLALAVTEASSARRAKKSDHELAALVNSLLKRMGSPTEQKGHAYIRDGIVLYAEAAKNSPTPIMDIYRKLAQKYQTTPENVERLCRNTLKKIWENCDSKLLSELFSGSAHCRLSRPSNSRFFATVAARLYSI